MIFFTILFLIVFGAGILVIHHILYADIKELHRQHYTDAQINRVRKFFSFIKQA